jgi:prefoldin alpha subunit
MVEKELQEKLLAYRLFEVKLDGLIKQRNLVLNKLAEIDETFKTIEEIAKQPAEILLPIGSEAHAYGKIVDSKKLIVEIGAGVALEKTVEEAKHFLSGKQKELEKVLKELQNEILVVTSNMENLRPEIERLAKQG